MKKIDIINESNNLPEEQRDAFVKGALWFAQKVISSDQNDADIIVEDLLPYDSHVVERFKNGAPKIILGPNQGEFGHYEATRMYPKGLWQLPSYEQLKNVWDNNKNVFFIFSDQGEKDLTTRSTGENGTWINPITFLCESGKKCHVFRSAHQEYPTRPIIDLSHVDDK